MIFRTEANTASVVFSIPVSFENYFKFQLRTDFSGSNKIWSTSLSQHFVTAP